jgi:ABC-type uncharacterized transport system
MPAIRTSKASRISATTTARSREQARVGTALAVLISFLLGLGFSAWWFHPHGGSSGTSGAIRGEASDAVVLSDTTKAVLQRLTSPLEIRFYALLDPATVSDSLRAYAGHVDRLLSAYQREAHGMINMSRFNAPSDANANAADADGLHPFNLDKGEACYLGITLARGERKESLPQLSPAWEPALESDLTRAIIRVTSANPPPGPLANASRASAATTEEVKRTIPNLATVSVEEGTRMLREAALAEFAAAAQEMETQVKAAQQRLSEARSGKSEAEQQAAMKQLQEIQAAQTEKLRQITAGLQARIAAFEDLKRATPPQ